MKLSQCKLGEIVTMKPYHRNDVYGSSIGHIVGLSGNPNNEVIPLILFAGFKEPRPIHHGNLDLYVEKPISFNQWFTSLPEGRQKVLREDKWILAEAAYNAGRE